MKSYKELKESLSNDYVLQSLADKDINAHVKGGKVVVHPDDAAEARKHLKKIGHDHLRVTVKGAHQVAESVELDEKFIDRREYASHGLMHPSHAKEPMHKAGTNNEIDFYASKTGDKLSGKVVKNDGKSVHIQANKSSGGGLHKFKVSSNLPSQHNESVELDEIKLATVGKIIKYSPKIASAAIGAAVAAHSAEAPKQPVKPSYTQVVKKIKEEAELDENAPVAPVPGQKWKSHAIMTNKSGQRVTVDRKDIHNYPEHEGWKEVSPGQKVRKEEVELDEVLDPSMGAGEYVKDFQKSDAPQFKGKSQEKRRIMGIAAFMAAKREKNK